MAKNGIFGQQIFSFLFVDICTHACGVPSLLAYTNSLNAVLYELISCLFILKMAIFWLKMATNSQKITSFNKFFFYANSKLLLNQKYFCKKKHKLFFTHIFLQKIYSDQKKPKDFLGTRFFFGPKTYLFKTFFSTLAEVCSQLELTKMGMVYYIKSRGHKFNSYQNFIEVNCGD